MPARPRLFAPSLGSTGDPPPRFTAGCFVPGIHLSGDPGSCMTGITMLHSREIAPESDCCQKPMTHRQRGEQAMCSEASCKPEGGGWKQQHAKARSAGMAVARHSATGYGSRGRSASV